MNNPYESCPIYETENFLLRLVKPEDSADLIKCYSDKNAVSLMNSDFCTNDFYFTTVKQMSDMIDFWLCEYREKRYVRFAVVLKEIETVVGTVEIFGGKYGVLRIDICSEYETENYINELFKCAAEHFYDDFSTNIIYFKTSPDATVRINILRKYGFVMTEEFRPGLGYYGRRRNAIAYCGLACCVCSENEKCVGCQNGGCDIHGWCKNYNCCREKGINGCWECSDFPCSGSMLDKPRIRAFARFVKEHGTDELTCCLLRNKENGIVYHYDGQLVGDYDKCETEDEIIYMIKTGEINSRFKNVKTTDIIGKNYFGSYDKTQIGCRGFITKDNRILVTHELISGWYLIPGGGLENGETPEECCVREVREETGYAVEPTSCFLVINEYYENIRYIDYYFLCDCRGFGEQQLTESEKKRGLVPEWIDTDELYSIFGKHSDYNGINEEKRGSYLREFTALVAYKEIIKREKNN